MTLHFDSHINVDSNVQFLFQEEQNRRRKRD